MTHCPNCGIDNPDEYAYCYGCKSELSASSYSIRYRKEDRPLYSNSSEEPECCRSSSVPKAISAPKNVRTKLIVCTVAVILVLSAGFHLSYTVGGGTYYEKNGLKYYCCETTNKAAIGKIPDDYNKATVLLV